MNGAVMIETTFMGIPLSYYLDDLTPILLGNNSQEKKVKITTTIPTAMVEQGLRTSKELKKAVHLLLSYLHYKYQLKYLKVTIWTADKTC
jgi:hypothetical protein